MNLVTFVLGIFLAMVAMAIIIVIQDGKRIQAEVDIRTCTMTDCYFNENLICRSLSDSWNPDLLNNCPDYTED